MTEEHVDAEEGAGADASEPGGRDAPVDPSENRPERPAMAGLVELLSVKRNALVGLAVGVSLAVAVYLVRALELLGPAGGTREYPVLGPEGYFFMLAVVLAAATALFVATLLTIAAAVRSIRTPVER